MATKDIAYFEEFKDFCEALREAGAFLVVTDEQGKPNVMTIGWAAIGPVWSEPVFRSTFPYEGCAANSSSAAATPVGTSTRSRSADSMSCPAASRG